MFGEKAKEYMEGQELPVWKMPKYEQAKEKAIELINSGKYGLVEADFWILMNQNKKKDKVLYSGLIISHNGCLKINDAMPDDKKFDPDSVTVDKEGYNGSLAYTYSNKEQGIYEVGEVSKSNCKNDYPYAMAFKRCFDRVVLKISKVAFAGIYSDSESDEFVQRMDEPVANISRLDALRNAVMKVCKGDMDKADASAQKRFGCNFMDMTEAQLTEVLGK